MNRHDGRIVDAASLRRAFDRSFAKALPAHRAPNDALLAVRVAGEAYAIPAAGISGLYVDRRIVRLPDSVPGLLGIAGFRGRIAPVYDLASLLGRSTGLEPRWLLLVSGPDPVALAFESFDGQINTTPDQMAPDTGESAHVMLAGVVRRGELTRPIVRLEAVLNEVRRRAGTRVSPGSADT